MARKIFVMILLFGLFLSVGSQAGEEPKRVMNLIAVMDLNCGPGIEKPVGNSLTDIIISELVKIGKYTVIDRANRDKILSEQGFQQTGCVEESCTVEAGQMLGVGKLVVGSITKIGDTYLINLQLINVQTGAVEIAADETCKCELSGLIESVRNAARKLMGLTPVQPAPQSTTQSPPSATAINFTGEYNTSLGSGISRATASLVLNQTAQGTITGRIIVTSAKSQPVTELIGKIEGETAVGNSFIKGKKIENSHWKARLQGNQLLFYWIDEKKNKQYQIIYNRVTH